MKPIFAALAFIALLAALVAVGLRLIEDEPVGPEVLDPDLAARSATGRAAPSRAEMVRGGVYAGIVVDEGGAPIRSASLLLVAWDTGEEAFQRQAIDPDNPDPTLMARVGFRTAAEGTTDASGRFRIAADRDSAIRAVFAWREGFSPTMVGVEGPREGIRIVLEPAGGFEGLVIDGETEKPIPNANVAIYLQSPALPVPTKMGERTRGARLEGEISIFAVAQRWVAEVLGPRIWGAQWSGDETIRVHTDRHGKFRFGPIDDEVQLEFVITHPEYAWTEFDRDDQGIVRRTRVPAGEIVERTFRMDKGKSIGGTVIDKATGRGVSDVLVSVEHVAQYAQHHWYRTKRRLTRTRRDGTFRVSGLSFGPYNARLEHGAFGTDFVSGIPEGSDSLQWYVESLGGLAGQVEGLKERPFGRRVTLVLESVEESPEGSRHLRLRPVLDKEGIFMERGVEPGHYRAWVQVGGMSSQPQPLEVASLKVTSLRFVLGGGGDLELRVWDIAGRAIDPATVTLVRVSGANDETRQALGRFVTREGRLDARGVVPGRYLAEVRATGFLLGKTEPFVIDEEGLTDAGDVTLREPATLQIAGITDQNGRQPKAAVRLSVKVGDEAFRPLPLLARPEVPVAPGPVTLRAVCDDGSSFEQTYEALDGQTLTVRIQLRP